MVQQDPDDWRRVREIFEQALAQPAERRALFVAEACRDEPAIHDQIVGLLASHDRGANFLEAPAAKLLGDVPPAGLAVDEGGESNIGRVIGSYCIESCIGHGGMGTVYRARRADGTFERRVAIKMIRRGMDPDVVRRFQHERQILASLDHPHIARLHDGGTTDDGVPYLVMELVDGSHIDTYCDAHGLSVSERLRLFRRVCDAVQYAHQRLVVHRDLKPSNILVQNDGVPKLLDFGIAKLLEPGQRVELTLAPPMTPAYASPEQIRGEPITTASDVYALGVLLYQLLTGRSPYPGDTRNALDLARAVCDTEPTRPSTVVLTAPSFRQGGEASPVRPEELSKTREGSPLKLRRRLAGDLDSIVLKALRKEPQRRYPSVDQFSEDLRRHLEGLPITASKGSVRYRAGKFVVRHKIGVAAAAMVLLAVLIGTAATAWQARRARQQAEIARSERTRAERRFNDVRALANSMIFELHDSIEDLPGATGARKLIVERALEYLDSLAAESSGDPSLQRELADAYKRIGELQGGPYTANVGDTPAALRSYERALSIRQTLLASTPRDLEDLIGSAELSRMTADALRSSGNSSAAREHTQRAVRILEAARHSHPENNRLLAELMRAYGAEASLYGSALVNTTLGNVTAALPLRRKQLEIAERLHGMAPGDQERMRSLASALSSMGDQLLFAGHRRRASEHYVRAHQLLLDLAGLSTSRTSLFALHDSYYRLLPVQIADGDLELARSTARRAVDIAQQMVAADPQNAQGRLILAADFANFAEVMSRLGRQKEARDAFDQAMSIDAELIRQYPKSVQFHSIRHQRFLIGGDMFYRLGRYAQAGKYYADARDLLRGMTTRDPTDQGARMRLGLAYNGMGSVFLRLNDFGAASQAYRDAVNLLSSIVESGSADEDAIYAAADAYAGLGEVEAVRAAAGSRNRPTRISHLRQALAWTDRSLGLWQRVKEPGLVSPGGYPSRPLQEVRNLRARISAELATVEAAVS